MSSRPISGSLSPARALSVSSRVYSCRNSPALPAAGFRCCGRARCRFPSAIRSVRRRLRGAALAAVGNDAEQGEAADPLALQQVGGERFLLLEQGGVQVADLQELFFGGHRVDHGPFHQVLEAERRDGIGLGRLGHVLVQVGLQLLFHELDIGAAAVDDAGPGGEKQRCVEDVLRGQVFVLAAAGVGEGHGQDAVQFFLDLHFVHGRPQASSKVHLRGNSCCAGQGEHLGDLGAGDVVAVDAADAAAAAVDVEHDALGLARRLVEYLHQDVDHEFHGGVVVVVQDDPVHFGFAYLSLFLYLQVGIGIEN